MAKKDFDRYFQSVCNQYHELNEELKELEETCATTVVNPTIIENMKAMIEPLKNNYMTLSYIKFLLDMPNKKTKQKVYRNQAKKLVKESGNRVDKDIFRENETVLSQVESLNNSLKNKG